MPTSLRAPVSLGDTGLSDGTGIPYSHGQKNHFTTNHEKLDVASVKNLPKKKNNTVEDNLLGAESCAWLFWAAYQYWAKHVIDIEQHWRNFRQIQGGSLLNVASRTAIDKT